MKEIPMTAKEKEKKIKEIYNHLCQACKEEYKHLIEK